MLVRFLPHLALVLAMFVWSTSFIALKIGLSSYTPTELMAGRMTVASIMFLPLARSLWKALRKGGHFRLLALMLLSEPCFYFLFESYALRYTSAAQAGMVVSLLPLLVGIAAWFFLGERVGLRVWTGFLMAVAGVVWLSLDAVETRSAPHPMLGNMLEMLAMYCATGYTVTLKRLSSIYAPLHLTAFQAVAGMLFFVPLALITPGSEGLALDLDIPFWLPPFSVVYLGIFVTLGGYGLYNFGVSRLTAGQSSAYTNLIPVMTLFLGVLFLHETFLLSQYVASLLVVTGVALSQQKKNDANN